MKVLCILQARCSSKRLRNKVLMKILEKPMIQMQIERIKKSKLIDELVIATSTSPDDDLLEKKLYSVPVIRGPLRDVLKRFYIVAKKYKPQHIVRLTGDCPLIDPRIIDSIVLTHLKENNDYTSNTLIPTYPDGLDVEIFKYEALVESFKYAKKSSEKEHVTLYIKNSKNKFKLRNVKNKINFSGLRWTVDYKEDFFLIKKIYEALYKKNKIFYMNEIIKLIIKNPDLEKINKKYERDYGLKVSLSKDKKVN